MMKKIFSGLMALGVLAAMAGASAPNDAQARWCEIGWCDDGGGGGGGGGGSGGGGGGGGGGACVKVYRCFRRPTGEWICGYYC